MDHLAILGGHPAVQEASPETLPLTAFELDAVATSLRHTPLTTLFGGYDVERLERSFAEKLGYEHAIAVSSGTCALHAAVAALGIGPGDEVIVTPHSFVASVSIVVQQGATPIFCDLSSDDLGIDVSLCEKLITPRTKAVLPVHVYGTPMAVEDLVELCHRRGLRLIEDCAAALGATVGGRSVGSFGDAGCFSFNVAKVLRIGEGGMVTTSDAGFAEELRELRVNGLSRRVTAPNGVASLGFNYTLGQAGAALGWATLERLYELIARRAENRALLIDGLAGLPLTPLLPRPSAVPVGYWTAFLLEPSLVPHRDAIIRAARAEGVRLFKGFDEPLYRIPYLRKFAAARSFPVAELLCPRIVTLDPSPFISECAMRQNVEGIKKVMRHFERLPSASDPTLNQELLEA